MSPINLTVAFTYNREILPGDVVTLHLKGFKGKNSSQPLSAGIWLCMWLPDEQILTLKATASVTAGSSNLLTVLDTAGVKLPPEGLLANSDSVQISTDARAGPVRPQTVERSPAMGAFVGESTRLTYTPAEFMEDGTPYLEGRIASISLGFALNRVIMPGERVFFRCAHVHASELLTDITCVFLFRSRSFMFVYACKKSLSIFCPCMYKMKASQPNRTLPTPKLSLIQSRISDIFSLRSLIGFSRKQTPSDVGDAPRQSTTNYNATLFEKANGNISTIDTTGIFNAFVNASWTEANHTLTLYASMSVPAYQVRCSHVRASAEVCLHGCGCFCQIPSVLDGIRCMMFPFSRFSLLQCLTTRLFIRYLRFSLAQCLRNMCVCFYFCLVCAEARGIASQQRGTAIAHFG